MNQHNAEEHHTSQRFISSGELIVSPKRQAPTEAELMSSVNDVLPELANLNFQEYIQKITQQVQIQQDMLQLLGRQQQAMGTFSDRKKVLWTTSKTIAEILLEEYDRGIQKDTEDVLNFINEVPMHSLITGGSFSAKAVRRAYKDLAHQRKNKSSSSSNSTLRRAFLTNVAIDMPQLNTSALSKASCAFGSFGGLAKHAEALSSSKALSAGIPSFSSTHAALEHFRSGSFSRKQLEALIGTSRAKEWKIGACVGCGAHTMVGECSLCYACELESEQFSLPENMSLDSSDFETQTASSEKNNIREDLSVSGEKRSVGQFFFALFSPSGYLQTTML